MDKQRANVRRFVAERWPDARLVEFCDEGFSATKGRPRPGFASLSARLGEFDAVVFDRQDRLARRPLDFWTFAAEAERHGTAIFGASEPLDLDTADGELTAGIRLAVARAEARRTGDRVRATNDHRRQAGRRSLGGNPPYGLMRADDDPSRFIPDPERAPFVVDAVERVADRTANPNAIAAEWNERPEVPAPRGRGADRLWSRQVVWAILRSPAIAGMIVDERGDRARRRGEVVRGPDGLPVVDDRGALVSVDTWNRLQRALDARSTDRRPASPENAPPLLAGLVFSDTGAPMFAHRHKQVGRPPYYSSRTPRGQVAVQMHLLDAYVVDAVLSRFGRFEEVLPVVVKPAQDTARLAAVRAEIGRTLAALASPAADVAALASRLTSQRAAEAEILAEDTEETIELRPTGRSIREAYEAAPDDDVRREIIAGALVRVEVSNGARGGDRRSATRTAQAVASRVVLHWRGATPDADA